MGIIGAFNVNEQFFALDTAKRTDINAIMSLEKSGFDPGIREGAAVFRKRIEVFPEGLLLLTDDASGRPAGYISSELWATDAHSFEFGDRQWFSLGHDIALHHNRGGNELYISSMTVDPLFRGKKLGDFLLSNCIERQKRLFPSIKSVVLIVNEEWAHAVQLYQRNGFHEIDIFEDFFTDSGNGPKKAIVMRRPV